MDKQELTIKEVTQKFQILGLSFTATKGDIRRARNRLLLHFHPDKFPAGWISDETNPDKRVVLIQSAYLYIMENYNAIMEMLAALKEISLTNLMPMQTRSYWAYTTIAALSEEATIHHVDTLDDDPQFEEEEGENNEMDDDEPDEPGEDDESEDKSEEDKVIILGETDQEIKNEKEDQQNEEESIEKDEEEEEEEED
jgi:hypothetical protein